ncbi:hypothetical protein ACWGII_09105 [Streptomyces sp. NPDC054855]
MAKKIEHVPGIDRFMTLDEIADFIAEAKAAGASGTDIPRGRLSLGGKLQRLVITVSDAK